MGAPPGRSWLVSLAGEHGAMATLIGRIDELIDRPLDETTLHFVACLLDDLAHHCRHHMALEERDGYLPAVEERLPNRKGAIRKLLCEHSTLQAELGEIRSAVTRLPDEPRARSAFVERLRRWITTMRDHEAREDQLVQESFNQDLGGGD